MRHRMGIRGKNEWNWLKGEVTNLASERASCSRLISTKTY